MKLVDVLLILTQWRTHYTLVQLWDQSVIDQIDYIITRLVLCDHIKSFENSLGE